MNDRKQVLVTGGAGYIGSHTVNDLHKSGFSPIIVDNLCNTSIENIYGINKITNSNIKWYNIDCTKYEDMSSIFKKENILGCIHFAAFKSVSESVENPQKYYHNNVKSLEVLLKCMNENMVKNIIFSSSCTVYGEPDKLPVNESAEIKKATSPYGETKQMCEDILLKNSSKSISLRYFNPIGSHSSLLIGDCSNDKASNLVPIICEVASGLRDELIINGDDYNTLDGTCVRDYIHVEDLSKAHVDALIYLLEKDVNNVAFNIGVGNGLSVMEIVNSFQKVNHLKINYKIGKRRKGDVEKIYSDNTLISQELKWQPKKSLEEALISAWQWQKKINK